MTRGTRRGSTLTLVLCLYLAMGAILLGALTVATAARAAAERDLRRSQALALAEAGVAEAQADTAPHEARPLGEGTYRWNARADGSVRLVTAQGSVVSTSGAVITRTVRARLAPAGSGWKVQTWEEGP